MPHNTLSTSAKDGVQAQNFCNRFHVETDGCWQWHGSIHRAGHGQFHPTKERMYHAHRYSYELFKEEIPQGGIVDHLCRNRACVNPEHLEVVTHQMNLDRGYKPLRMSRKYWCYEHHPLDKENTGFTKDGDMFCKECSNTIKYEPKNRWTNDKLKPLNIDESVVELAKRVYPEVKFCKHNFAVGFCKYGCTK